MWSRLVIEGNAVYEIDDECVRKQQEKNGDKENMNSNLAARPGKPRNSK